MSEKNNLSAIERIKVASDGLRGSIEESLSDEITGAIREDDTAVISFMECTNRMIGTGGRKELKKSWTGFILS